MWKTLFTCHASKHTFDLCYDTSKCLLFFPLTKCCCIKVSLNIGLEVANKRALQIVFCELYIWQSRPHWALRFNVFLPQILTIPMLLVTIAQHNLQTRHQEMQFVFSINVEDCPSSQQLCYISRKCQVAFTFIQWMTISSVSSGRFIFYSPLISDRHFENMLFVFQNCHKRKTCFHHPTESLRFAQQIVSFVRVSSGFSSYVLIVTSIYFIFPNGIISDHRMYKINVSTVLIEFNKKTINSVSTRIYPTSCPTYNLSVSARLLL